MNTQREASKNNTPVIGTVIGVILIFLALGLVASESEPGVKSVSGLSSVETTASENEPENGAVLERTFQYYGSCIIRVTAKSGPAIVTVADINNPSEYVRFYIRKGDAAETTVRAGTYSVSYQTGDGWREDLPGFGVIDKDEYLAEVLELKTYTDPNWTLGDEWEAAV